MSKDKLLKELKSVDPVSKRAKEIALELSEIEAKELEKKSKKERKFLVPMFKFVTQTSHLTNYRGPSGKAYSFVRGAFTPVSNVADAEFFAKNKRFKKKGALEKNVQEPQPDIDKKLVKKLLKINGVSEKTAKKVAEEYLSDDNLADAILDQGEKLQGDIPEKQAQAIVNHYMEAK